VLFTCLLLFVTALYIRPAEIVPALQFVPLVDILTVISLVIGSFTVLTRQEGTKVMPADFFVAGFYVAVVMSNLAWGWFGGAMMGFINLQPTIFCYYLARVTLVNSSQCRTLARFLVGLTLFQAVNGIVQYHTGVGLGDVGTVGIENRIRGTGIFHDPNDLAMALVLVIPYLLTVVLGKNIRFFTRVGGLIVISTLLLAIFYTNSRGAILGLGAVLMLFAWYRYRSLPGLVVGVIFLMALTTFGPSRSGQINSDESSAQTRIEAWSQGLLMLKSKPIFGVGYNRFTEFHRKVAHNSFVHTFAELGLFGVFFFVGVFYAYFKQLAWVAPARGEPPSDPLAERWRRDFIMSATGMLVCAFFLSRQYIAVLYLVAALGTSYAVIESKRLGKEVPSLGPADAGRVMGLVSAGIVMVWLMVRTMGSWAS
jgi:O-antigen ligase